MERAFVFRAQARPYLAVSLFMGFFLLIGVVVMRQNPAAWPLVAITGAVTAFLFGGLAYLRLEVGVDGIRYRSVSGHRSLPFAEIKRAYFETIVNRAAPHGVAAFWIQPIEGKALKINLRTFPIAGAALLLAALERHGIPVDAPHSGAGQRMAREVRGHQVRGGQTRLL